MRREAAIDLVRDTFEHPFEKERFVRFTRELLNRVEDASFTYKGNLVFDDFRDYVESLERVGKYQDNDGNKLDILIVRLRRATSLERARTAQRQFVAKYLKGSRGGELKDAALVAFVSPDHEDWRFSFVRMEYKIETTERGRVRVKEEFTPARRYSFLVGQHENSHTAQSRLLPILEDSDRNPTLAYIEDAFSVEKVTKEFFEKYRELYLEIKDSLDAVVKKDKAVRVDFTEKGIETADFSKKLLGQIVFLYFLQKKGWFGVARNAGWGSGPKNFLRKLCSGEIVKYKNFFNDVVEPLFYEALASGDRDADWYSEFKCKVPFLNGGLFDPINGYDWVHTDILLPNDLFTNKQKTKQGDIGTGILDVFDRYNFTVKEDEPLEKEVAVDPEMLGKVFENLLEVKDRKSKGTYYTPREIVHFMCQESLINYLNTELESQISREDIVTLVKHGESALENDVRVIQEGRETNRYYFKLPDSIRDRARDIDEKLAAIKVCDPAVGSGAFLVGMMSEIVRSRQVLTGFTGNAERRSAYYLKRHAIQNSLHGVDIDASAVEIAKLRLWLSLVVDEGDYKQIQPLPNLDYKIMQGNSLLETYEGIELIDRQFLAKQGDKVAERARMAARLNRLSQEYIELHQSGKLTASEKTRLSREIKALKASIAALDQPPADDHNLRIWGKTEPQAKADRLLELYREFFAAYHKREKERLHREIESLTWDLIETTLRQQNKVKALQELKDFQRTNTRPFFLWQLFFADVFRNNGGFDSVIANPPYGIVFAPDYKSALETKYPTFKRNNDIYVSFFEHGLSLLKPRGSLIYISPNTYLNGDYFKSLRALLTSKAIISEVIDFKNHAVFEDPTVFVCITSLFQGQSDSFPYTVHLTEWDSIQSHRTVDILVREPASPDPLKAASPLMQRILERSQVEPLSKYFLVKDVGFNYWTKGRGKTRDGGSIGHRVLYSGEPRHSLDIPFIKGRDIHPFVIGSPHSFLRHDYISFLNPETDTFRFSENILRTAPKVVYRQTASKIIAAMDTEGLYCDKTVHVIVPLGSDVPFELEYLLGFLNSALSAHLYTYISQESEGRTFAQVKTTYIKKLPLVPAPQQHQKKVIDSVRRLTSLLRGGASNSDHTAAREVTRLEEEIDELIFDIYRVDEKLRDLLRKERKGDLDGNKADID